MTELQKIFVTSVATVIGGVFVFSFGQLVSRFIIEPVFRLRSLLGEVAHALVVHDEAYRVGARFAPTPEKRESAKDAAKNDLLRLAGELNAQGSLVLCWEPFVILNWIPSRTDVLEASLALIQIANSIHTPQDGNLDRANRTRKLLGLAPRLPGLPNE